MSEKRPLLIRKRCKEDAPAASDEKVVRLDEMAARKHGYEETLVEATMLHPGDADTEQVRVILITSGFGKTTASSRNGIQCLAA
jgi:hypothetical protein